MWASKNWVECEHISQCISCKHMEHTYTFTPVCIYHLASSLHYMSTRRPLDYPPPPPLWLTGPPDGGCMIITVIIKCDLIAMLIHTQCCVYTTWFSWSSINCVCVEAYPHWFCFNCSLYMLLYKFGTLTFTYAYTLHCTSRVTTRLKKVYKPHGHCNSRNTNRRSYSNKTNWCALYIVPFQALPVFYRLFVNRDQWHSMPLQHTHTHYLINSAA